MVEFMERNGDLSKPSGGPRGRQWCIKKWEELTARLNSEGEGDSRTDEKWRKVWSDFKNNTKKKWAKMNRAARGTGGGPALKICLTDLEQRVMAIIGEQAASGLPVIEAGFEEHIEIQPSDDPAVPIKVPAEQLVNEGQVTEDSEIQQSIIILPDNSDWTMPGTSSQTTPLRKTSAPVSEDEELPTPRPTTQPWKPPPKKAKKNNSSKVDSYKNCFLDAEKSAREYEREHDKMFFEIEKERVRQRDIELQLQAQWMEFMKEF